MAPRGVFVVLEGVDRAGKSTQCERLVAFLAARGTPAVLWRFPNRTTATGKLINEYLAMQRELDDHAVHLMFSANRDEMERTLASGTSIVADRYAFSGVAFSAAKGLPRDWCAQVDRGLIKPDLVLFLDVAPEVAQQRGGFGEERYEESDLQRRVRGEFQRFSAEFSAPGSSVRWAAVDAGQSLDAVSRAIEQAVSNLFDSASISPLSRTLFL